MRKRESWQRGREGQLEARSQAPRKIMFEILRSTLETAPSCGTFRAVGILFSLQILIINSILFGRDPITTCCDA